jgi:NUMOD3 motif
MSIYCPLAEALGIDPGGVSILDIKDYAHENAIVPGIRKGMLHTEETKKLMSEKRQGGKPMLGKSHSVETKQKMKESRLKYLDTNEGQKQFVEWQEAGRKSQKRSEAARKQCLTMNSNPDKIRKTVEKNKGQKRSEEQKQYMSERNRGKVYKKVLCPKCDRLIGENNIRKHIEKCNKEI